MPDDAVGAPLGLRRAHSRCSGLAACARGTRPSRYHSVARDLGAAEAARDVDADCPPPPKAPAPMRMAFCTRALHSRGGSSRGRSSCWCDAFGHQRGIEFGLSDLDDVEVQVGLRPSRQSFLRSVSMSAPFLPMMTPGRAVVDRDPALAVRARSL